MNSPRIFTGRGFSICLSCRQSFMRQFSSTPATFTSFQSYPLNPPQSLPQNVSVSNGSIARPLQSPSPRVHETRPPKEATLEVPRRNRSPQSSAARGSEAQTPKSSDFAATPSTAAAVSPDSQSPATPTTARDTSPITGTAATSASLTPKPRSKLRTPRKAAIKLTPSAVSQIRALLDQPEPKLIKVGVRNRGCSGLSYSLEFVDKAGRFDETVEQDGVRVLIDSKALFSIIGSEMDWVEDKLSQKFVFRNPNISKFITPKRHISCTQARVRKVFYSIANHCLYSQKRNADAANHSWCNFSSQLPS